MKTKLPPLEAMENGRLVTKTQIYRDSKLTDEITFVNERRRIELRLNILDKESGDKTPVRLINLALQDAKRIRAMLDIHIKSFEK
jgi:hypothetical protein